MFKVTSFFQFLKYNPGMQILEKRNKKENISKNLEYKLVNCKGIFLLIIAIMSFVLVLQQSLDKLWKQMSTTNFQEDELELLSLPVNNKTISVQFTISVDKS